MDAAAAALEALCDVFAAWLGADEPFHVFVAGSYRLGTLPVGDIDVVLVVRAATVPRGRVFDELGPRLRGTPGVTDLQAVPHARVPLLGFKLHGQEFDVLTCHLHGAEWPPRPLLLSSYAPLNGADDASILAFSGVRVVEWLCSRLVAHFAPFRGAVQTLREWAKRRAIYSNKAGFLGGINLVLLAAAAVLELQQVPGPPPPLTAEHVVRRVFQTCSGHRWGARSPMELINNAGAGAGADDGVDCACPVVMRALDWKWKHAAAAPPPPPPEPMVLLTPCYPRTNTLFAATAHTAAILRQEFRRAHAATAHALCAPLPELQTCTQLLRVRVTAPDTVAGRAWLGYIEAQTRHLVRYIAEQPLGLRWLRYVPHWYDDDDDAGAAAPKTLVRATVAIAEPLRALPRGKKLASLDGIVTYFWRAHGAAGPQRPKRAAIAAALVPPTALSSAVMAAALAVSEQELQRCHGVAETSRQVAAPAAPAAATALPAPVRAIETRKRTLPGPVQPPQPRLALRVDDAAWRATRVRVACAPEDGVTCTYVGPVWPARRLGASVLWRRPDIPVELWLHSAAVQVELRRIAEALPHVLWCPCAALKSCHAHALVALVTQQREHAHP
jgi:poly(A) polymerase